MRTHLNQPMRREIWERLVGQPLDDIFRATYAHYETPLAPDLLDTLKHTYRAHMREHAHSVRAFPGVVAMLDALRERGIRLAIVTTKHRNMAERHLETSGLTEYFEFLVPGDEVTKPKPDAESFFTRPGTARPSSLPRGPRRRQPARHHRRESRRHLRHCRSLGCR